MKAVWNGKTIAETDKDKLIYIEGNWYFPPESIDKKYFNPSYTHTVCTWKGQASYYNVEVDGGVNSNAAWFYPDPKARSIDIVKADYTNYVAFWGGIKVEE